VRFGGEKSMKLSKVCAALVCVAGFASALSATPTVPELDPGNLVSVGMLLGGALLVVRGRKK
jgi:hypothetical protein